MTEILDIQGAGSVLRDTIHLDTTKEDELVIIITSRFKEKRICYRLALPLTGQASQQIRREREYLARRQ
jgi:hypothetical protein